MACNVYAIFLPQCELAPITNNWYVALKQINDIRTHC